MSDERELAYGGVCPVCGDEFTDGYQAMLDHDGESVEGVRVCVVDAPDDVLMHLPEDQDDEREGERGWKRAMREVERELRSDPR